MLWLKTDSEWKRHPKARALGRAGDQVGANARLLWFMAGSICNDLTPNTGVVTPDVIDEALFLSGLPTRGADALVARLVKVDLWHDPKTFTKCKAPHTKFDPVTCREALGRKLAADEFYFHHWYDSQLATDRAEDPVGRQREKRRRALNRPGTVALREAIHTRDLDICRYCGVLTIFGTADKKSANVGQLDHVDPFYDLFGPTMGNTLDNLVVACKQCNSEKRDRTPEQWFEASGRMVDGVKVGLLRPPPDQHRSRPNQDRGPDLVQIGSGPDLGRSEPLTREAGRSGSGTDRITDRVQTGSGSARSGSATGTGPGGRDR